MGITIDYLIPYVRVEIGDTDSTAYRYLDEWIVASLILAVKKAQRYWRSKYHITDKGYVTRSTTISFDTTEAEGIIEDRDEPILVLLAAITILEGGLENQAWNVGSWKDAEISYSNIEGGRIRNDNIKRLKTQLDDMIKAPTKRLAWTQGAPLPGFMNEFERKTEQ